jgi:hypothetical protein
MHCHNVFNTYSSACCVHRICSQSVTHSWFDESFKSHKNNNFPNNSVKQANAHDVHMTYMLLHMDHDNTKPFF